MTLRTDDTITAIGTPPGEGGIAIVRLSGPDALAIADSLFRCAPPKPSERPPKTIVYGHVVDNEEVIDEALLLILRAPHSYTVEDMVEIQGHGGSVTARRVLRAALQAGARLAQPGEFTQRAFLNGRIDLLQAEAVLDIVRSQTDRAAQAALLQLGGSLSARFNALNDQLVDIAADIEATLDFPDDEMPTLQIQSLTPRLQDVLSSAEALLATWNEGHLLRDGALVVISGPPNVGKSTLLNSLLCTDRAIVSHIPGTTRDVIEEGLVLDGIPVRLVDTAGLRDPFCDIEREGIRRTRQQIERADIHLFVCDASAPFPPDGRATLDALPPDRVLVVLNKTDLGSVLRPDDFPHHRVQPACLLTGAGLQQIRTSLREILESGIDSAAPPHATVAERHRRLLLDVRTEIRAAAQMLDRPRDEDLVLVATALRTALTTLGHVTGRVYEDDLLDQVFSRFCIGK